MLLSGARALDVGDVPLAAEEIDQIARIVVDRPEMQGVPESAAVLAVVQQFDDRDLFALDRAAHGLNLFAIGAAPLEEAAIATEDFVLVIAGQLAEGAIGEDDGIVVLVGIGEADRHAGLRHGLFEQHARSAFELALSARGQKAAGAFVEQHLRLVAGPLVTVAILRPVRRIAGGPILRPVFAVILHFGSLLSVRACPTSPDHARRPKSFRSVHFARST